MQRCFSGDYLARWRQSSVRPGEIEPKRRSHRYFSSFIVFLSQYCFHAGDYKGQDAFTHLLSKSLVSRNGLFGSHLFQESLGTSALLLPVGLWVLTELGQKIRQERRQSCKKGTYVHFSA